jgi:AAA domain
MIVDPKQMQAVDAGPVIDLLRRALGPENVPELGSSVRQKGAEERETALMFRNGQTAEALDRKVANDTLHIAPGGYREAIAHVTVLWQQRRDENRGRPDYTITVSAPANTEAYDISVAMCERRRAMGEIGADKITVQAYGRGGGAELLDTSIPCPLISCKFKIPKLQTYCFRAAVYFPKFCLNVQRGAFLKSK